MRSLHVSLDDDAYNRPWMRSYSMKKARLLQASGPIRRRLACHRPIAVAVVGGRRKNGPCLHAGKGRLSD